jgi:hypothetical protein
MAARMGVMFSSVKHYDYIALHAQKATKEPSHRVFAL